MNFENRFYMTDKMLSEYVYKVLWKKYWILGSLLSAFSLIMLILTYHVRVYSSVAVYGTVLFISLFTTFLTPFLTKRQMKESGRRIHNGENVETVVEFGEDITMKEGAMSMTIKYSQIQRIIYLKSLYVLKFGKQNAIVLSPDGFTVGNAEEFKKFIESKVSL